jgi:hypothetical protein
VVEVRVSGSVIEVKAGQHWPSNCLSAERPNDFGVNAERPAASRAPASPPKRGVAQAPTAATPNGETERTLERASALAAPNDLFAEGVAKRRQGDVSGALRAYQELLSRFPRSALAENALVERMRLLASIGAPSAAAEAKRYLARYPGGFAVKEAEQLAVEP